jgi:hypothetical protein
MSLIAKRCICDWADWSAKKQNERIGLGVSGISTCETDWMS